MAKRVQSPSSINTYNQCPRRYFYQYLLKLPTGENIYSVKGKIVHSVLEKFFDIDIQHFKEENYKKELSYYMKNLFNAFWIKNLEKFEDIGATEKLIISARQEIAEMLANWLQAFFEKIDCSKLNFHDAFQKFKPVEREAEYKSEEHKVKGFIDVVENVEGEIKVLDYKTSGSFEITESYELQLAIYALLYKEKHGVLPHKLSIWFLKDREKTIEADEKIIEKAINEIKDIHIKTSSNCIDDYPKKTSPLCKWKNGQCDFYEQCFGESAKFK
ncbi:MAG TPA: PD-(D/E)XK nuclease family protein [Candidatus Woesearchaeota archaeon]|nr:PD-(D/E)XK nuclease family protein [Candidatus Woesearchaeota archaeon]